MGKMQERYRRAEAAKVGDYIVCPSCGHEFVKTNYQTKFCKTKPGTKCKDKYWNTVTPTKRNNTTRISPASQRWLDNNKQQHEFDPHSVEHPFSSEALGQW